MTSLRLTRAAAQDIEELERYSLEEFGAAVTDGYLMGLHDAFVRLRDHPGMGIGRDDLRSGTRSLRYRSHRIYYRTAADIVTVQRILHAARIVRREMLF